MLSALRKLDKILELECQGGYQNRAVIGGVQRYIPVWIEEARGQAGTEGDGALVEQIGEALMGYADLPGAGARAKLIGPIRERLQRAITASSAVSAEAASPLAERPPKPAEESDGEPCAPPPSPKGPTEPRTGPPKRAGRPAGQPAAGTPRGLAADITTLRGIGPRVAEQMGRLGIRTIHDLLTCYPRRYVDYSQLRPINRLEYGDQVTIIGTVRETTAQQTRGRQKVIRSSISDDTATIQCTWFNQPWLAAKLTAGATVMLSGMVDQYLGRLVMTSPEWELVDKEPLHTGRIVPVYPLTAGLGARMMRSCVKRAVDYWARRIPDHLPADIRDRQKLVTLDTALTQIHFPDNLDQLANAQRRLAFDELLLLQLGLFHQRRQWQSQPGIALKVPEDWLADFLVGLPFQLTDAQQHAVRDVLADLANQVPMNRLLQGDVGSGKTVVAAAAMAAALRAGTQAALMAPTEILAEQHASIIGTLLPAPQVRLLTGSVPAAEKQVICHDLAAGTASLVVGTHALIQEGVEFQNLGLVIVDEQHRFGVEQRKALRQKGHNPHLLVMTATPIPRTLALTLYGDLDLSVIDELPPGRQPISTYWIEPSMRERAYRFIRSQVTGGRQAFIICPLVEASDSGEAKSAVDEHGRLQRQVFPDLQVGLLHGRMKSEEKEQAMQAFYRGETQVLVSTSVVEVGIDVPNASVMMVEGANRFGLAQLHQFRGRVGRGLHESYCLLVADSTTPDAEERLSALETTHDGFALAEKDLELRGPGEFFGTRQSGMPDLKMAQVTDVATLERARQEAKALSEGDPLLEDPEHRLLAEQVEQFWFSREDAS